MDLWYCCSRISIRLRQEVRADADSGYSYGTESAGDGRNGKAQNPPCSILSGVQST